MKLCIVAGSFGYFHTGHKKLLDEAARTGFKVVVGLTSDQYTFRTKRYSIPNFLERSKNIERYLDSLGVEYQISQLGNTQGDAIENRDYAVVVASRETEKNVRDINTRRIQKEIPPMEVRLVDTELAQDLFPISSRRIASGEIDADGRRIKPISVVLLSHGSVATVPVLSALFNDSPIQAKKFEIESFPQHADTSKAMSENLEDRDYAICIFFQHHYGLDTGKHFISVVSRILDRHGVSTEGTSGSIELSDSIYNKIMKGENEFFEESNLLHEYFGKMAVDASLNAVIPRRYLWEYGITNYFSSQP